MAIESYTYTMYDWLRELAERPDRLGIFYDWLDENDHEQLRITLSTAIDSLYAATEAKETRSRQLNWPDTWYEFPIGDPVLFCFTLLNRDCAGAIRMGKRLSGNLVKLEGAPFGFTGKIAVRLDRDYYVGTCDTCKKRCHITKPRDRTICRFWLEAEPSA